MDTLIITFLSIVGFLNAFYLYWQHKREVKTGKKMFCLIGGDCGEVVGSKYGQTFGIKNEIIGMVYYPVLAVLLGVNLAIVAQLLTIIAALFSLYLLFIQTMVLRKFCSWCLIAIAINFLILYLVIV